MVVSYENNDDHRRKLLEALTVGAAGCGVTYG